MVIFSPAITGISTAAIVEPISRRSPSRKSNYVTLSDRARFGRPGPAIGPDANNNVQHIWGTWIVNLEYQSVGFLLQVEVTLREFQHTLSNPCNMSSDTKEIPQGNTQPAVQGLEPEQQHQGTDNLGQPHSSKLVRFYAHPWTQILLISFICFCLPGVSD